MIRRIGRIARATVLAFLRRVIVEPVRDGRLRDVDWPLGLRPIVALGLVGYVLAAALVLASGALREWVPLEAQAGVMVLTLPRALVWIVLALTAYAMTLALSGALHARAWFRWLVTGVVVLSLLSTSGPDRGEIPMARIVAVLAAVGIVVLVAVRGHRRFSWIEFAIVTVLVWGSLATTAAVLASINRPYGYDFLPLMLSLMLAMLGQLAIPAALAAGAAVASFAVSSALWAAKVVRRTIGSLAVRIVLGLVAVWRTIDVVLGTIGVAEDGTWRRILGSLMLLVLVALVWWGLARLRPGRGSPAIAVMIDRIDIVALAVSAVTTSGLVAVLAHLLAQTASGFGVPTVFSEVMSAIGGVLGSVTVLFAMRGLGGIGLLVLAVVLARRGRRTMPELYAALGLSSLVLAANVLFDFPLLWSEDGLALVGAVAALAVLVVLLVRRRLTPAPATSLLVALLMSALFAYREIVTDPIAFLLGFAGAAVVLFGFVWAFLTGYDAANEDSPAYPRPARVQLVLANALFGVTVLAFVALARDPSAALALEELAGYGAQAFGDPLIAAGLLLSLAAAIRGHEIGDAEEEADA